MKIKTYEKYGLNADDSPRNRAVIVNTDQIVTVTDCRDRKYPAVFLTMTACDDVEITQPYADWFMGVYAGDAIDATVEDSAGYDQERNDLARIGRGG